MFVLNEKKYIEGILNDKLIPEDLSFGYLLNLVVRYTYLNMWKFSNGSIKKSDLVCNVKNVLREFSFLPIEEYKYIDKVKVLCSDLVDKTSGTDLLNGKPMFRELDFIPLYQSELDIINTLTKRNQKKFLFTLYMIARFMDCDGWVNKKDSKGLMEIFKLANVTIPVASRYALLNLLYENNYISFSERIDNLNIKVPLCTNVNENVVYKLTEFENVGNKYVVSFIDGYKQCVICGKVIKNSSNNKNKYCPSCARKVQFQQIKKYKGRLKESQCS